MIEITKPNRNNGIELLISDNDAGKKEEEINGDENSISEKKTIKLI